MANAIEVHDLVKVFGQDTVLKGINRNFEAGRIHGVVGNNGSGKTVMFKCICGFLQLCPGDRQLVFLLPITAFDTQLTNNKPIDKGFTGLHEFIGHAIISYQWKCQRNNLTAIRWVGENFLIPGHTCIEHHFSCSSKFIQQVTNENAAVLKNKLSLQESHLQNHTIIHYQLTINKGFYCLSLQSSTNKRRMRALCIKFLRIYSPAKLRIYYCYICRHPH